MRAKKGLLEGLLTKIQLICNFGLDFLWIGQVVDPCHLVNHATNLTTVPKLIVIPKVQHAMLAIHNSRI